MSKFYITTPAYYVNARPHIGHAYSTIAADVLARRHRLLGDEVFFLTGTDEHGQKIERAAEAAGVSPKDFADEMSTHFFALWARMGISVDGIIRTTDSFHVEGVQHLFNTLWEKGYIYLDHYTGHYCVGCEAFVDDVAADSLNPFGGGRLCVTCGRETEITTEENFFFKLSAFTDQIIGIIESDELFIEPVTRKNEVLSFLRKGVRDLSISRTGFDWGIPVPEPAAGTAAQVHVIYVWLDALANYMTVMGYGEGKELAKFWPPDVHIIGKEITRFHCIYWPAFLLAAGIPLPKRVTAHGWLLFNEEKMSKSLGNVIRTEDMLDAFGEVWGKQYPDSSPIERDLFAADVLRYYLLRRIPFGQDGNFSTEEMVTTYNSDLANGLGNLVSRTFSMLHKFLDGKTPTLAYYKYQPLSAQNFAVDLTYLQLLVNEADEALTAAEPWKLAKLDDEVSKSKLQGVLALALQNIHQVSIQLYPFLPFTSSRIYALFGIGRIEDAGKQISFPEYLGGQDLQPIYPRATDVKIGVA